MPPKKGKKGKRGGDSSDDEPVGGLAEQLSKLEVKGDEQAGNKKVSKKLAKGGKKKASQRNDSDDDVDPLAKMKALAGDSDNDTTDSPALSAMRPSKKDKKKAAAKKGGKRVEDSDSDDPLQKMKAMAAAGSSDDEEEEEVKPPAPVPSKGGKKTAGKKAAAKKGGKRVEDTDSDDPLEKVKAMAAAGSSDEEEEKEGEKEEEKDKDEEQDADEEEGSKKKVRKGEKEKKEKKEKKSKKNSESLANGAGKDSSCEDEPRSMSKPAIAMPTNSPHPAVAATASTSCPLNSSASTSTPVAEPPTTAAATTSTTASEPKKKKKLSKLEQRLENARREKEAADRLAAAAAAERAAEEKCERLQREAEAHADAAKAAVAAAADAADAAADDVALGAAEESKSSDKVSSSRGQQGVMTEEELKAAEARKLATMYGDDVFDEQAGGSAPAAAAGSGGQEALTASGKKMSNKAKRKLQQEAERKEREVEYNAMAMKASAEGAQFAVSQSIIDPNDPQWQNMLDIIIPNLSISAHKKELFINAELSIVHGRRYGLVGPNGAGKSTLLKMIASGQLKVPPRVDYLYVEQEVMADDTPAVDAVLKSDKVRWELVEEEKQLMRDIEELGANDARDTRLGELHEQLATIGAAAAESRARRILFGLGFDAEMQVRATKFFSGGWRMRISLARALFIEPTLLMLDEPTNHLDLNAVIWLDDYLQRWKKTLLVVSHDQDFLNSVCQEIIHLESKKLVSYRGNYDSFKEQQAVRRKQLQKDWEKQEKKLRELKAKGATKDKAEKVQLKAKSREPGARSKKQEAAAAASGGLESGESQVKLIERPRDYQVVFDFPQVVHLTPPIMEVRDVNFQYRPELPWLFRGLNFGLDMQSRVCIVGPNGSGKSTVLKLITGELEPPEGEVRRNPRLRVGVYNQHFVERLTMEEDPVTYLRRLYNEETYQSVRNKLGKYGLEGHAHTIPIRDLSGGQKARVVFVELSLMAPHLLFLDEPTNNLDIESIDALCDALREYNGGVVLVSHDSRLINTTECQLWVVEDQGLTPWQEGFDNYRQHLLRRLEEQMQTIMPGSGERPA